MVAVADPDPCTALAWAYGPPGEPTVSAVLSALGKRASAY
jgi:hypothetical protein